jgi:hypothetical protein
MQKTITTLLVSFIVLTLSAQKQRKISSYLNVQFNTTLQDATIGNNPWGAGIGLQTFFKNKTTFKPTIELTGAIYLADDKVYRMNADGTPIDDIESMVNLFAGTTFTATQNIYFSIVGGPSFINEQTLLGIKPSVGFYFTKSKRGTANISYINIFNRDRVTKQDFGSVCLSLGFKLF